MDAVISLGGSVVGFPPNVEWLKMFRKFVEEFEGQIKAIVVGGGPLARQMISIAREFGVRKEVLDKIGIESTMLNAWIVRSVLDGLVADSVLKFSGTVPNSEKIVIYGGSVVPGLTTDFVAAILAEHYGVNFVNITRVGGIYDKNPDLYEDAKLIPRMSYEDARKVTLGSDRREPGTNFPIDIAALAILQRSSIKTYIVGPDLKNLENLFRGKEWRGTELLP